MMMTWPVLETTMLHTGVLALLLSLAAYVARSVLPGQRRCQQVGWLSMLLSTLCLLTSLIARSFSAEYFALSNMYESLLVLILWMQIGFLVVDARLRQPAFAWAGALLLVAALGYDTTLSREIRPLQPALQSYWRSIHVPVIILSYAMFSLAFLSSILRLVLPASQQAGVASASAGHDGGRLSAAFHAGGLQAANLFDELTYRFVSVGFPLLAIGIILGGLWANEAWGNYWSWDPKESMSLVTLLGYGVYLHMRVNGEHSPRKLAWVSVLGFMLMLVTYVGVNMMGIGLHSYGKIQ